MDMKVQTEDILSESSGSLFDHQQSIPDCASSDSQVTQLTDETEAAQVQVLKLLLVGTVVLSACLGTYLFVDGESRNDYKLSFDLFTNSIRSSFEKSARDVHDGVRNLADTISASAEEKGDFPFVSVDLFETHGEHALDRSKLEGIVYAPFVAQEERSEWERYASLHQDWIEKSREVFINHLKPERDDPVYLSGSVSPYIYSRRHGVFPQEANSSQKFLAPIWHLTPPPFNPAIVNLDASSQEHYHELIENAERGRTSTLSAVVDVEYMLKLQISDSDHLHYHEQFTAVLDDAVGYTHPHSLYARPVFSSTGGAGDVVGVLIGALAWDAYFKDLIPDGITGIFAVLQILHGEALIQEFTYELNGTKVSSVIIIGAHRIISNNVAKPVYLGEGDFHDKQFDHMVRELPFFLTSVLSNSSHHYTVRLYPSNTFVQGYRSKSALVASLTLGVTFLLVAFIFCIYDSRINIRSRKAARVANKSNAVVSSLFPSAVRSRILEHSNDPGDTKPIADHFPETTILFADIVGFTAWSSKRQPSQVFFLLETIYGAFDAIATRQKVFKVETIGDCYVASCGVPKSNRRHAEVMAKFAVDCLSTFRSYAESLDAQGLHTKCLALRVGLHSGPVTAGVLRGERARFQLFGDTMNTASRIETTSQASRIQCSAATATLLRSAGKESWITPRDEKVVAKGKGELQTYWVLEPHRMYEI